MWSTRLAAFKVIPQKSHTGFTGSAQTTSTNGTFEFVTLSKAQVCGVTGNESAQNSYLDATRRGRLSHADTFSQHLQIVHHIFCTCTADIFLLFKKAHCSKLCTISFSKVSFLFMPPKVLQNAPDKPT